VFLYAPRAEKIRRLKQSGRVTRDVEELVDSIDRDRRVFVKHYFGADWPTRSLYHLMINTSIGDENVMTTILHTMRSLDANSGSNLTEFQPGQFLPQT
jgi:cytidylate kinase